MFKLSFSTEYFIPIKEYPLGIPLNCTKNINMTDGEIIVNTQGIS